MTVVAGALHLLKPTQTRPLFLIAYAGFLGNFVEGFVVDIDHWRHLYLLMAIVWGLMAAATNFAPAAKQQRPARLLRQPSLIANA
jgi:hypothetical protein